MNIHNLLRNSLFHKISAAVISLLGILLLILGLQKEVTLVVNGEAQQITTYAITVRGVLRSQDYSLSEEDHIHPSPGTWLWGDEAIYFDISSTITIQADGNEITLQTAEIHPLNVLLEAGYTIYPKDRILVDGVVTDETDLLAAGRDHEIQILRGTPITLLTETGEISFISDADYLAQALEKAAISTHEADLFSLPLDTKLDGSPLRIIWTQAEPLQVQLADQMVTIHTTADTVGTALAGAGLALQGMDYSIPAEDQPLPENRQVQIVRVREEILLNQEKIQFSTTYQPDDSLELDNFSILSGGEFGINAQRVRVTYEDDQEISRYLEKEWILRDPSPRIIGYGTQVTLQTTETPDGPITYWRKITAWATSYNENCEGCKTYTATGHPLRKGVIAVKLDWFYYMRHMKVYIPGYGFASVEDVGGGVPWSTNWVDLGYKQRIMCPGVSRLRFISWRPFHPRKILCTCFINGRIAA
jgi:uncharacterized protein YabE (DUF348 family)